MQWRSRRCGAVFCVRLLLASRAFAHCRRAGSLITGRGKAWQGSTGRFLCQEA